MQLEEYLAHNPKKHLIFDLDRTLAELHIDWSDYFKQIWETVSLFDKPLAQEVPFTRIIGSDFINRAVQRNGEKGRRAIAEFNRVYEIAHYRGYTGNPSLISFIHTNKDAYTLYIWTSNSAATIQDFLLKEQVKPIFVKIASRDNVKLIKPAIDGFKLLYDGKSPLQKYLMIGDSSSDKKAAEYAGIEFFGIDYFPCSSYINSYSVTGS